MNNIATFDLPSKTLNLIKEEDGILYYEDGWWMKRSTQIELDYHKVNKKNYRYPQNRYVGIRTNEETREMELEVFFLPYDY